MVKQRATTNPDLGQKIRQRRKYVGLTQADLASEIGISFQQMQKYEKGINAISLARLQKISEVLKLPPNYFLDGEQPMIGRAAAAHEDGEAQGATDIAAFFATGEGHRLAEAFTSIGDIRLRTRILDFIVSVAADAKTAEK